MPVEPSTSEERRIEPATSADIAPLAELLASVFLDDAGLAWMVPDDAVRKRTLPSFFRAMLSGALRYGRVVHAPDNRAVSVWRLPGRIYPGLHESLRGVAAMYPFVKHAGARARILDRAVRSHAPSVPFRYLQFVAVAPERRGTGLGGALIRSGLAQAAQTGEHVYLETAKPENIGLYVHHGFEIIDEWSVEGGGPKFTSLLKPPYAQARS